MKLRNQLILALLATAPLQVHLQCLHAQGTAFSYQGRLYDGGNPAVGIYDLRFSVFDSTNIPGNIIAGPVTNVATVINNGLFTATFDFGPNIFTGAQRWIQTDVRTNNASGFTPLWPRQAVLSVPYAMMASSASNLLGTVSADQLTGAIPFGELPSSVVAAADSSASGMVPIANGSGGYSWGVASVNGALTNGSSAVGFTTSFFTTNTGPVDSSGTAGAISGVWDAHTSTDPIYWISQWGNPAECWSADPHQFTDFIEPGFNVNVAAGGPIGNGGLPTYLWNVFTLSMPGDGRSCVAVNTVFGTNEEYGSITEFLPRKSIHASISSGIFAHPLRLDGYGRVMVGNIPETYHTRYYPGNAYLDLWTGGNTDVPAFLFEQEGLVGSPIAGALERGHGSLFFTDDNSTRHQLLQSGTGINQNVSIQTNPAGPHGIILQFGNGLITNTATY